MADRKITDLTALAAGSQATGDLLTIVDVSEAAATDKNKKITVESLFKGIPGNVGIGTSSPAGILELSSSSTPQLFISNTSDSINSGDAIATLDFRGGSSNTVLSRMAAVADSTAEDGAHIVFENRTGGGSFSEKLRIDSSGNVGIGASSSLSAALTVVANTNAEAINVRGRSSDNVGEINFWSNDESTRYAKISARSSYVELRGPDSGNIRFNAFDGTELTHIDSSGFIHQKFTSNNSSTPEGLFINNQNNGTGNNASLIFSNDSGNRKKVAIAAVDVGNYGASDLVFALDAADSGSVSLSTDEKMRIDSSGQLLVGTSSSRGVATSLGAKEQIETTAYVGLSMVQNSNDNAGVALNIGKSRGTAVGATTAVQENDSIGTIFFAGADGTDLESIAASISTQVDGTPGSNDMPGRLVFSTTADNASSSTERMRITSDGAVFINKTVNDSTSDGVVINRATDNEFSANRSNGPAGIFGRNASDGDIVLLRQAGSTEGSISVSGTTVSYNGAHLSRWSQLPSGAERIEILRGTVLSNIDEMCEWGEEENEQLNRMQVSNVEGDRNVAGVFQAWDDDDDTYINDFYCAMTGDFVIRIAQGTTVVRGDLLMSAGDGTAKPQDDDIVRSKTIAKVTSTTVSTTYADGSYCVPCVLMAC